LIGKQEFFDIFDVVN